MYIRKKKKLVYLYASYLEYLFLLYLIHRDGTLLFLCILNGLCVCLFECQLYAASAHEKIEAHNFFHSNKKCLK